MKNLNFQEFLSLGYLYLLILGIVTDVIFYNYLGIQILDYSSLSDILLSPIKYMTQSVLVLIFIGAAIYLLFLWNRYVIKKNESNAGVKKVEPMDKPKFITMAATFIMCLFLGIGIGRGWALNKKIADGKVIADHLVVFNSAADAKPVKIIAINSQYLFYIPKAGKKILISPIASTVQSISKMND